jgi:hypothetical protein
MIINNIQVNWTDPATSPGYHTDSFYALPQNMNQATPPPVMEQLANFLIQQGLYDEIKFVQSFSVAKK